MVSKVLNRHRILLLGRVDLNTGLPVRNGVSSVLCGCKADFGQTNMSGSTACPGAPSDAPTSKRLAGHVPQAILSRPVDRKGRGALRRELTMALRTGRALRVPWAAPSGAELPERGSDDRCPTCRSRRQGSKTAQRRPDMVPRPSETRSLNPSLLCPKHFANH
jgi:hypothetical protein